MKEEVAILTMDTKHEKCFHIHVANASIIGEKITVSKDSTRYMFATKEERDNFLMEEKNLDLIVIDNGSISYNYRENLNQINLA